MQLLQLGIHSMVMSTCFAVGSCVARSAVTDVGVHSIDTDSVQTRSRSTFVDIYNNQPELLFHPKTDNILCDAAPADRLDASIGL